MITDPDLLDVSISIKVHSDMRATIIIATTVAINICNHHIEMVKNKADIHE